MNVKRIVSASNNIFNDMKILTKRLYPKFHLIPILCLQVVYDYVHWHCTIDYGVKLILVDENLYEKLLLFHTEMISA